MLCVGAGIAGAGPVLVLVGLVAAAGAVAARRLAFDLAIVAGALALLSAAVLAGLAAGYLRVDLLARPHLLAGGYLTATLAVAVLTLVRPARAGAVPRRSAAHRLAGALPLLAVACAGAQVAVPGLTKSWAFWGTDVARQMTALAQVQTDGMLDYRVSTYPRGLHMLAALASVPDAPLSDRTALLGYDAVLVAALTWLSLALLLVSGTALAVRVVDRLGQPPVVGLVASVLLVGGGLLTNTFLHSFVYAGAAASLVAVAVLHGLLLVVVEVGPGRATLLVGTVASAIGAFLVAHLWQALLLGPVLVWLVCVAPAVRHVPGLLRRAPGRRRLLLAALVGAVCVAAAADPLVRVQQAAGLAYAAVPGSLDGPPWRLLAAGLVATAALVLTRQRRDLWVRGTFGMTAGLAAAGALLLHGTGDPTDLGQYYPMKAAWLLALTLAPVTAAVAAVAGARVLGRVWLGLGRAGRTAFAFRAALVGLLVGPGLGLWTGYLVGLDSGTLITWQRAVPSPPGDSSETLQLSAVRYDVAREYGSRATRAVVPWDVGTSAFAPNGSMTTSLLLTFLTGQPEMPGGWVDVCGAIDAIAGGAYAPAVVLTQYPVATVQDEMADGGCAGRAPIVATPNTGYLD